jgi:hypothetical protein
MGEDGAAYTQQNGRAERLNRTIMEMARSFIIDAGLGHQYWEYAAAMAAYSRNRTPTAANSEMMSPFEALRSQKPDLRQLPLFGAMAIVHVPDEMHGKLEAKSKDCICLGFAAGGCVRGRRYQEAVRFSRCCH